MIEPVVVKKKFPVYLVSLRKAELSGKMAVISEVDITSDPCGQP